MTELLPVCSHCKGERMQEHCPADCGWGRCLDCHLITSYAREES